MLKNTISWSTTLIVLLLTAGISASEENRFTEDEAAWLTAATLMGAAHFCVAYGVDYRELADKVHNGVNNHTTDIMDLYLWNGGFDAGRRGELFSASIQEFLDISLAESPQLVCAQAHREAARIEQMK